MFMQVGLREEDRDALRYLWRGNRRDSRPPEVYRMKVLIFGASCSPATAIYVMNRNAERHRHTHPEAVEAIKKKHYMDDYLDSYEDEHRAITIATQVRNIHREAHFELRKWTSNSPAVLKALGESPNATEAVEIERTERVLGLIWRPQEDRLAFNLDLARIPSNLLRREAPTKREALKIVMSLFDPLGLVSPITVRAKQLLQEVWRRGTDWDDPIDDELSAAWVNWLTHLKQLSGVTVPRCYPGYSRARKLQLHVFTDASESAYATALYWRAEDDDGRVTVTLLAAKAKQNFSRHGSKRRNKEPSDRRWRTSGNETVGGTCPHTTPPCRRGERRQLLSAVQMGHSTAPDGQGGGQELRQVPPEGGHSTATDNGRLASLPTGASSPAVYIHRFGLFRPAHSHRGPE
ncbi:uncharacterized protein LOC119192899 [Manduca sexta]|uniref:uncharacterized protein LOC119192899 n=1 Tax=Manduca sexta TaxID=7130 RepID=UPI001890073B|nr:uncharacterized protein LOC119192899 [Manduca sexta]